MSAIRNVSGWIHGWAVLGFLFAGFGCDAQASPDYRGESLLTLSGSVELTQQHPDGPLVPALLFPKGGSYFDLVDVDVKGEFPSGFQIDVYEPPPTIPEVDPETGDPPSVSGFISAVPKKHPAIIRYATTSSIGYNACGPDDCTSDCKAIRPCTSEASWCSSDNECYYENRTCPEIDSPPEDCTITKMEGDPTLRDPFKLFAGFSSNYVAVYLSGPVSHHSYTARALNAPHALDAGYHLVGMRQATDEEKDERRACNEAAARLAVDRENARRGTDYSYDDVIDYTCSDLTEECAQEGAICVPPPKPVSRLCELPEHTIDEIEAAVDEGTRSAKWELGCRITKWIASYIEDPSQERITVELSTDSNPLGPIAENQAVR